MLFQRLFTADNADPFDAFTFTGRPVTNEDVIVVVPETWSQTAVDILATKYMRRAGVPLVVRGITEPTIPAWLRRSRPADHCKFGRELDARQVFRRLAGGWTYAAWKAGYFGKIEQGGVFKAGVESMREAETQARVFFDEILYMLAAQMAAPASPQWFNTGLWWAYGLEGEASGTWAIQGGNYRGGVLPDVKPCVNAYENPQSHACFIQSLADDLVNSGGIMDLCTSEARVFKFGGGSGTNFSALRGAGEPLAAGGQSSGLLSFLRISDRAAGSIKSGGTTRRAAKMIVVDVDHPDIEAYVGCKVVEEQKAAALITGNAILAFHCNAILKAARAVREADEDDEAAEKAKEKAAVAAANAAGVPKAYIVKALQMAANGFKKWRFPEVTSDYEGEAYSTTSFQNGNNSIRITNDQMLSCLGRSAREDNNAIPLYWRTEKRKAAKEGREPVPSRVLNGPEFWQYVNECAWACADPGIQFADTINDWNPCKADGDIEASNPCAEYLFLNDTGCNLASLNLLRFFDGDRFNVDKFRHATTIWTVILDVTVGMAGYPTERIARGSAKYRTLGLGYCNIGASLMRLGIPYDSNEGRGIAGAITAILHFVSAITSAYIASELGTYPRYDANKEHHLRVMRNHRAAAFAWEDYEYEGLKIKPERLSELNVPGYLLTAAQEFGRAAVALGEVHGYRNAQLTLCAPTGTIGLLMDADTTGIEPDYALVKFKKLAGGGYFKIVNQSVKPALLRLGYTEEQADEIVQYVTGKGRWIFNAPHGFASRIDKAGLTGDLFTAFEEALSKSLVDIRFGIPAEILKAAEFTAVEIRDVNRYLCGTMTTEGAPYLKAEHYDVFDCANKCGADGTRNLTAEAHLTMMAACQPFFSGGISKTVNLPPGATVADVAAVHTRAWELACKDVALYRDGSKLSQPLSSEWGDLFADKGTAAGELAERIIYRYLTKRRRLPSRRPGYTQKAKIQGQDVYVRASEYPDGTLGEIWIDLAKEGASMRSWANCLAISVSLGLQHGVPLEEYVDAFVGVRFEPSGLVDKHPTIKTATSVPDLIFKELAITYLDRHEFRTIPVSDAVPDGDEPEWTEEPPEVVAATKVSGTAQAVQVARTIGYEGEGCSECGYFTLKRNGSCLVCETCGTPNGGCG